jgi:hypothetical protein
MAGLDRAQQLFNRAVLGTIAALIGFARGDKQGAQSLVNNKYGGHPILAKLIKRSNPRKGTPGYPYPGYTGWVQGRAARERKLADRVEEFNNFQEAA